MVAVTMSKDDVQVLVEAAEKLLDYFSETFYENDALFCYYNDENGRDAQAHIEKTFNNGRFSREKKTCCHKWGNWFCAYK